MLDGKGDAFPDRGNYSTQTRIDATFDVSLKIPTYWQGLSIKPAFTLFGYEDQITGNHVFDRTYNLVLSFNMDRHSRIGLREALFLGPASGSGGAASVK